MRTTTLKIAASLALALLAPPALLQAQTAALPAGASTARVIVKYKADSALLRKSAASATEQHAVQAQALGARIGLPLHTGRGVAERTQVVFASGMSSEALAARLARESDVEYAVPDRRKARAAAPNDSLYATAGQPNVGTGTGGPVVGQWYLRAPNGTTVSAINAESAWNVTTGSSSVVVAVLDTGVRFDHPDLAANLLAGYDMVGQDRNDSGVALGTYLSAKDGNGRDSDPSDPGDGITLQETRDPAGLFYHCTSQDSNGQYVEEPSSWHGTQTSGLIGAITNNGTGMASVGRNVKILPVRVLSKCGGWDSDITAGMLWAAGITVPGVPANTNPAKVLNLSLGGSGNCNALYVDTVNQVTARGAVIVASAGNDEGLAVAEPANCAGVIGVAGLRHSGTKVGYSDLGPEVSISAPAGNCVNTGASDPCLYPILTTSNKGKFDPISDAAGGSIYTDAFNATLGTSFSAPMVSGAAALILSVHPNMTPSQVRSLLRSTASAFPAPAGVTQCVAPSSVKQAECACTTSTCGAGMLNVGAALQSLLTQDGIVANIAQAPLDVLIGSTVTLDASATALVAGSPGIASYAWTVLDDGGGVVNGFTSAVNAQTSTLVPSKAGRFVVQLVVTDLALPARTSTTTATIYVHDIVTVPPVTSGGGGGGALGLGWLAALLLAVFALWRARPAARSL